MIKHNIKILTFNKNVEEIDMTIINFVKLRNKREDALLELERQSSQN